MAKKKDDIPVTCIGMTTKGKRCTIKTNLVDNYCVHHHPEGKEVHTARLAEQKAAEGKPAQPSGGEELFINMLRDVLNPTKKDDNTKFDFVNGQPTEVIIDEVSASAESNDEPEVQHEIIDPSEKLTTEEKAILEKYAYLLEDLRVSRKLVIENQKLTAEILKEVEALNYVNACRVHKELDTEEWSINRKIRSEEDWHRMHNVEMSDSLKVKLATMKARHLRIKIKVGILAAYIADIEDNTVEHETEGFLSKLKKLFNKPLLSVSRILLLVGSIIILFSAIVHTGDFSPKNKTKTEAPVAHQVVEPVDKNKFANEPVDKDVVAPVEGHNGQLHDDEISHYKVVKVEKGDTLWDMAVKEYGDGSQWTKIWDANKDQLIKDDARNIQQPGHWIHTGQLIEIPIK